MQITIKVLKGQDCTLDVNATTTVLEIKQKIEKILKIPCTSQKLLMLGRPLSDDQALSAYPTIRDGSKLILIEKKPDIMRDAVHRSFRRFYNEQQSEKLLQEFMADFANKLKQLSYDDIERLAENLS